MIHRCHSCAEEWTCDKLIPFGGAFSTGSATRPSYRCCACYFTRAGGYPDPPYSFENCPKCNLEYWERWQRNLPDLGYYTPTNMAQVQVWDWVSGLWLFWNPEHPDFQFRLTRCKEKLGPWVDPKKRCKCNKCKDQRQY